MFKISQQQSSERWDILPISLREALYSPGYGKTIWEIGANYHLNDEKIGVIMSIAGYIVFGFIHSEDLAKEIRESLNLNPEIANSIAQEIDRKIFSPIKTDLEKVYSPVPELPFDATPASIKTTAGEPKPAPFPIIPTVPEAQKVPTAQPKVPAEPLKTVPTTPVPADKPFILHQETEAESVAEKKKVTLPAIGWFKKAMPKTEAPVPVQLETFSPEGKKPFDAAQGKEPTIAKTEAPKQKIVHYREVKNPTPFGTTQTPAPVKPPETSKPPEPQPSPEATAGEAKIINLDSFE